MVQTTMNVMSSTAQVLGRAKPVLLVSSLQIGGNVADIQPGGPLPFLTADNLAGSDTSWEPSQIQRVAYLDSTRFLAAILVLSASVLGSITPTWRFGDSFLYPVNSNLGYILFLAISGRVLVLPWLIGRDREDLESRTHSSSCLGQTTTREPSSLTLATPEGFPPKDSSHEVQSESILSFKTLGMAMFMRPFRFLMPALVITGLQYATCGIVRFKAGNEGYLTLLGMLPHWCFSDGAGWIVEVTNLFVMENTPEIHQRLAGGLWTLPWHFQGSFYLYGLVMVISSLRTDTRISFLVVLSVLCFASLSFLLPMILGVIVAELQVSGKLSDLTRWFVMRRFFVKFLVLCALMVFLWTPQLRNGADQGLARIQTIRPSSMTNGSSGYDSVRISDCLVSFFFLIWIEISPRTRSWLVWRPLSLGGRHLAAGLVSTHHLVIWSILPSIKPISDREATSQPTHYLGIIWIGALGFSLLLSIPFRLLVEIPSELLGRFFLMVLFGQDAVQLEGGHHEEEQSKDKQSKTLLPMPDFGNPRAKLHFP
ncbi:hypothetical protein IE53DRAFT_51829 [Violaceomyces palustris]|uniref:Uncharacterized protein n=1 Tax=Violaceomyces palustris TaxID=1673888 RepID=A0ACD0NZY3_9BASI|nr:hypothetical protein IE53DRAFT_51829 [Violaceomyces palustris]